MKMRRSLLAICLEIARDKFRENSATVCHAGIAEQFERQAKETQAAIDDLEAHDEITLTD